MAAQGMFFGATHQMGSSCVSLSACAPEGGGLRAAKPPPRNPERHLSLSVVKRGSFLTPSAAQGARQGAAVRLIQG